MNTTQRRLIGSDPNQVPLNGMLGRMAFMDPDGLPASTAIIIESLKQQLFRQAATTTAPDWVAIKPRWGEIPIGRSDIGSPGGVDFGVADPLFTQDQQFRWLDPQRNALAARIVDLEQKMSILWALYLREVSLRSTGITIGIAGQINFGVGPAVTSGAIVGINEQDYYPVHTNSNSLM